MRERSGSQGQPSQTEIYSRIVHFYCFKYFLLPLEKQRKRWPFFNFFLRTDMRRTAVARPGPAQPDGNILQDCSFLLFQILSVSVTKAKETLVFFQILFGGRICGGRAGGQDQPRQTEIYYRIVHFYGFKYFLLALEKQRTRWAFFKFCLADGCAGGAVGPPGPA